MGRGTIPARARGMTEHDASILRRAVYCAVSLLVLWCAAAVRAEPPTPDSAAATMRATGGTGANPGELDEVVVPRAEAEEKTDGRGAARVAIELPPLRVSARSADAAALRAALAEHVRTLHDCYARAQRSDRSLRGAVRVQLHPSARGIDLRVEDANLGKRHLLRCLRRELGPFRLVPKLEAAMRGAHLVVLGPARQS